MVLKQGVVEQDVMCPAESQRWAEASKVLNTHTHKHTTVWSSAGTDIIGFTDTDLPCGQLQSKGSLFTFQTESGSDLEEELTENETSNIDLCRTFH